ncbi:MAG: SDR family oxidoreductase [Deltaproteobacteria bacterium]|nr:SDR family oxidoreductase [Deltaproteobacteria bacterium]
MKALVTGGAGFIGSHVAAGLLARGDDVRILDNLSTGSERNLEALEGGFEFHEADLRDDGGVERAVEGTDVVFHLAAQVSVPLSIQDPILTYEVNSVATARLLEACVRAGARRVVFSSSCAVYGDSAVLPKREDMLPEPLSPYAATKLAGEHMMTMYGRLRGLQTVSLRYFNVFGPRQDPSSEYSAVIPRFIDMMRSGKRPIIFGDGRQTRDFVYVQNVVEANLAAAGWPGAAGQVLNIGSGESIDLLGLVSTLDDVIGTHLEPVHEDARTGDIVHSSSSVEKARDELGWTPGVSLAEGLARTVEAFGAGHGA